MDWRPKLASAAKGCPCLNFKCSATASTPKIWPQPWPRGQNFSLGLKCLTISNNPSFIKHKMDEKHNYMN